MIKQLRLIKFKNWRQFSPKKLKKKLVDWYMHSSNGRLSWFVLSRMAMLNFLHTKSRTMVTVGAISIGVGSIVFLMSFAYGLQSIVTERIVQPNSFRLADVQSDSTALSLNQETISHIKSVSGVEDISPVISLAGSLSWGESRTDVVILGVRSQYFEYSSITPLAGEIFSAEADELAAANPNLDRLIADIQAEKEGAVLGVSESDKIIMGEEVSGKEISFQANDESYLPVRSAPQLTSPIIGYLRGSVLDRYEGVEVWGSEYETSGTEGRSYRNDQGQIYGRWLKAQLPLYQESAPTVYLPLNDENGVQQSRVGYLAQVKTYILSDRDAQAQDTLDQMLSEYGEVLGESTQSAEATPAAEVTLAENDFGLSLNFLNDDATDSAALANMVNKEKELGPVNSSVTVVEVAKIGGKEVLVSTALLDTWEIDQEEAVGQTIQLRYIVSGGLIPGLTGRVLSQPVDYQIVGVVKEDKQSLLYAPLSDLESMGIEKYSFAKVLTDTPDILGTVREKIESFGFSTRSVVDTLVQVERLFKVMRFLLGAFGLIALIVALFGMFNTMTISLLERTREIGVMKTLGTTDYDVVRIFLVESLFVGLSGGIIGVVLGIILGWGVNLLLLAVRGSVGVSLFRVPPGLAMMMIFISIIVGVVTGLYPANRAKKISALDALRYE